MTMKYFIFLTIIGVAIACFPGSVNFPLNRLYISKRQLAEAADSTVKPDILDQDEQNIERELIELIKPIVNDYMLQWKEIVKENPEFLSDLFKKFENSLRSVNGKERRELPDFLENLLGIFALPLFPLIAVDIAADALEDLY